MKNIINNVDVCESDNDDSVELETPWRGCSLIKFPSFRMLVGGDDNV
jgi:hypothetical protein